MKGTILLILLGLSILSNAQSICLDQPWMDHANFFDTKDISALQIRSIEIYKNVKRDGKTMGKPQKKWRYLFNQDGLLIRSTKYFEYKSKVDSNSHVFSYNENKLIKKRDELLGRFHFRYLYSYDKYDKQSLIKLDMNQSPPDTNYVRYFEQLKNNNYVLELTKNEIGLAFKKERRNYDMDGRLLKERISFVRNTQFAEQSFIYSNDLLNEVRKKSSSLNGVELKKIVEYKNGKIDLVKVYRDNELTAKYAYLFDDSGLLENIIERDLEKLTITVYDLEFTFFNQN